MGLGKEEEAGQIRAAVSIGDLIGAIVDEYEWNIVKVWAQQGGEQHTLYTPAGGKVTVQLSTAETWELHVAWSCINSQAGYWGLWTAGITVVATGVASGYQKLSKLKVIGSAPNIVVDRFTNSDFDVQYDKPTGNITISRIKFWATQSATSTPPPEPW